MSSDSWFNDKILKSFYLMFHQLNSALELDKSLSQTFDGDHDILVIN